ncbi:hypothetical protein Natpe_1591 [Natrinema pellirubrum DSM 15624]|uniref:Uncharacterized protein n=1 Tax=Natrinema pellirubrum (strain DSM 15624 / CIP 106293 / JCM 10476 / NCIMB 786 / 157) TaxID=797303 RepID=L0JJN8_NATP1|nr:hypothetical protein [Natrinema pellirubrum]AGB31489.1 hypothetical protein Natpe_1591 [Natrinema pellirubrum DSM 15624]
MNNHFHDSRYYLARAAEHARLGVAETLGPHVDRVRSRLGLAVEDEPEPSRLEAVQADALGLERRAAHRVRGVAGDVRGRVGGGRSSDADDR